MSINVIFNSHCSKRTYYITCQSFEFEILLKSKCLVFVSTFLVPGENVCSEVIEYNVL